MHLLCLSFHHLETKYANFEKVRFKDPSKFYEISKFLRERVLIQTGTRVEVYALIDAKEGIKSLLDLFSSKMGVEKDILKDLSRVYFDEEAIEHLFRLAGCIESRVFGETYIPKSVEYAFYSAKENAAVGPFMESLFNSAAHVAERSRTETKIEGGILVEDIAVNCILGELPTLKGKTVVLLGAGLIGLKTAKLLAKYNPKLIVANRNYDIGAMTAEETGGRAVEYSQLEEWFSRADLLICATLASHYRVTPEMLKDRSKTLVIIDVSPFRNVDPEVASIPNVILKDGKLRKKIEQNMKVAEAETPKVEEIIREEVQNLPLYH